MRIAAVAALVVLLTAGCSSVAGNPQPQPGSTPAALPATTTTSQAPSVPGAGTPLAQVVAWVQAGTAVDASRYHSVIATDGTATQLPSDVAFVSPSGKLSCATEFEYKFNDLVCTAKLRNPPPRPAGGEGEWIGGWIDYPGTSTSVGSFHGDPGPFVRGQGAQLPYGSQLVFHNYSCRMDAAGLFCVNPQDNSGVKISDSGVIPFGCLQKRQVSPGDDVGLLYKC